MFSREVVILILAMMAPIGVKFCMMVQLCNQDVSSLLLREVPTADPPNLKFVQPRMAGSANALV